MKAVIDVESAQEALDMGVMYSGTEQVNTDTILIAIDYAPLQFIEDYGFNFIEYIWRIKICL